MKNVYRQIMHHQKQLTKLEKIAADYFMQSKLPLPLRELAEEIHLSPATISRFVRKVDFEDYEQFLESYIYSINENKYNLDIDVYKQHMKIVEENHRLLMATDIEPIISKLTGRRVLIIAKEDTSFACFDFANRLKRLYIDVTVAVTKQEMVLAANFLSRDDVVIAVSISGYNTSIDEFLHSITDKELVTIGISTQMSPMLADCDYHLQLFLETTSIMSFNFSYSLPLILLFDHLYVALQQKLDDAFLINKDITTNKIIS